MNNYENYQSLDVNYERFLPPPMPTPPAKPKGNRGNSNGQTTYGMDGNRMRESSNEQSPNYLKGANLDDAMYENQPMGSYVYGTSNSHKPLIVYSKWNWILL